METSSRKIIKKLEKDGFALVKVVGSHHKFKKGTLIVTVPHPKKDLPLGRSFILYILTWLLNFNKYLCKIRSSIFIQLNTQGGVSEVSFHGFLV